MENPRKILVTGIPGSGSNGFCQKYSRNMNERGKNVTTYHTGRRIENIAQENKTPPFPPTLKENFFNFTPHDISEFRNRAIDSICEEMKQDSQDYDGLVINTHSQFFWKGIYYNALEPNHVEKISPDMFVTIIDSPSHIHERQKKSPILNGESYSLEEILKWQNFEVNSTEYMAHSKNKINYVFPSKQNPEIIESLLDNYFLVYFSIPMTDADSNVKKDISEFNNRLLQIGREIEGYNLTTPVIDPRFIDLESDDEMSEREKEINEYQTVHRDLNWYITPATHLIAYFPPHSPSSTGASQEMLRAYEQGKTLFVVSPKEKTSPFSKNCNRFFTSEEEFFKFFKKHMEEKLEDFKKT